jgi:hypothetical protein
MNQRCIHKETGHIGRIEKEMKGRQGSPDQWGIRWFTGKDGHQYGAHIQLFGLAYYWNDKEKIALLKPTT